MICLKKSRRNFPNEKIEDIKRKINKKRYLVGKKMKSPLMEETWRNRNEIVGGLFFETEEGILIMEDGFDFRNYKFEISSGYIIVTNKEIGKTGVLHYNDIKEKLKDGREIYEEKALTCGKVKDIAIGKELAEKEKLEISEGVLFQRNRGIMIAGKRIGEIWDFEKMNTEMEEKSGKGGFWNPSVEKNVIKEFSVNMGNVKKIILGGKQYGEIDIFLNELENLGNLKTINIKNFSKGNTWFTAGETDERFFRGKILEIETDGKEKAEDLKKNRIFGHDWKDAVMIIGKADREGRMTV